MFHVAGVLASYGPTSVVLGPSLLTLWLGRSGVAAALLVVAGWTFLLAHRLVIRD